MGEAWSGRDMDPYLPLDSSWPSLAGTGYPGLQAARQQLGGSSFNSGAAGQSVGLGSQPLPELDNDFIDCLLANLQVPMLPPQQQQLQQGVHQQQQFPRATPQPQLQHLQMPQSAPSCSTVPEAERADHESEAGIAMPSSDDREASPMIARLKERNRKAQRAFRARQKEKSGQMAKRVKELSDQLNHLQVQHEQLMQRNKLLEMALGSGQEQRNRSSSLDIKKEEPAPVRQSLSNQSGASAKLEKHPSTDSHLSTTEALQPDEYFEPGDAEQEVVEFVLDCGATKYTITDAWLRAVQLPEFSEVLKSITFRFADFLKDPTCKDSASPTGRELEDFLKVSLRMMGRLSLCNWRLKHAWLTTPHMKLDPMPEPPSWDRVKSVLQLEPWQTQQILALRNHFWELQNSVLTERQKVEASLQQTASKAKACTLAELSERHVALHSQAQQLSKLWQRTYAYIGRLVRVCWLKVLKPWQAASFEVAAWPYAADTLWMAENMAQDAGLDPGQPGLLETRFPSATVMTDSR